MNSIQIYSVFIKRPEESTVLKNDYSEKSIRITVFFINLQQSLNLITREFQKFKKKALKYVVSNQYLFQQVSKNILLQRVINSKENQKMILTEIHDNSDHCRHEEIYWWVTDHYWWGGLYKDIQRYVKTCKKCQCRAPFKEEEELHPTYVSTVWEKVEVDVVHLPPSEGCHYLVMAWDDLSEWLKWHTLDNVTAETVIKFLYQNIFCCHSYLQRFIMNRDSENKREIEELLK